MYLIRTLIQHENIYTKHRDDDEERNVETNPSVSRTIIFFSFSSNIDRRILQFCIIYIYDL